MSELYVVMSREIKGAPRIQVFKDFIEACAAQLGPIVKMPSEALVPMLKKENAAETHPLLDTKPVKNTLNAVGWDRVFNNDCEAYIFFVPEIGQNLPGGSFYSSYYGKCLVGDAAKVKMPISQMFVVLTRNNEDAFETSKFSQLLDAKITVDCFLEDIESDVAEEKLTDEDIQAVAKELDSKGRYRLLSENKEAYIFFVPGRNAMGVNAKI